MQEPQLESRQNSEVQTQGAAWAPQAPEPRAKRPRRWLVRVAVALACVVAVCGAAFGVYVSDYYHAAVPTEAQLASSVPVIEDSKAIAVGSSDAATGLIFYPGAKVDPAAYLPLMQKLADRGVYCVIVKMPFNLAVLDINAADEVLGGEAAAQVESWWIGGHSLGGAMAAQYASAHAGVLEGIVLLGAYAASDLSGTDLEALVIYGSEDGVLNREKLAANESNLPADAQITVIEGGNHAGFGTYGAQKGDGEASISADAQQQQAADLIAAAMLDS